MHKETIIERIKRQSNLLKKEYYFYDGRIKVFIKDPLPENINVSRVLEKIEGFVPYNLIHNIDVVYIGHFEDLVERDLNAKYENGAIYLSNIQNDHNDMVDDIIHEMAHAVEELYGRDIYFDSNIEMEFVSKRKKLERILKHKGIKTANLDFTNVEYNTEFDEYLYQGVGYPTLRSLTVNLFVSPYGATSLREYFANGFEAYFLGARKKLQDLSPQIYIKIKDLIMQTELY